MERSIVRMVRAAAAYALLLGLGGCLGGSTTEPAVDAGPDGTGALLPPEPFHMLPRASGDDPAYAPGDYESIHFEGILQAPTSGTFDWAPFKATWYDLTADVDLCRSYAGQGPSCRIWPDGSVKMDYPGNTEGVPVLEPGMHDVAFRVYWMEGEREMKKDATFQLLVGSLVPPAVARIEWSPSAGTEPLTSDTLKLVVELDNLTDVNADDVISFDVEWKRNPPLPAATPRMFTDVPACTGEATDPAACRVPKGETCVGDEWSAVVTLHNSFGEAAAPLTTDTVTIANMEPVCAKRNPDTDPSVCTVGVASGSGVRADYECTIRCSDNDNLNAACDPQSIHYRFEWAQPSYQTGSIASGTTQDDGRGADVRHRLEGRAAEDDEQLGTALGKGELVCRVYPDNVPVSDAALETHQSWTCRGRVLNTQPTLGRACIQSENEGFEGRTDQNTTYTCLPDAATLADPDDDTTDSSLFLYRYEWRRTPPGGNPMPLQNENDDQSMYPLHCAGPGSPLTGLRRNDSLCCRAVPRNPDETAYSTAAEGTAEWGFGDECCVTIGNTPPMFVQAPRVLPVSLLDGAVVSAASEGTAIRCDVAETAYFDCDGDSARPHNYEWWVEVEAGGTFQLHPAGEPLTAVLGPESFNKGDTICCKAVPNDGMDTGLPRESEACVTVRNSAPVVEDLRVEPLVGPKNQNFSCVSDWQDPDTADSLPGAVTETYTFIVEDPQGRILEVPDQNGDGKLNPGEAPSLAQGDKISCCLVLDDHTDRSPRMCSKQFGAPDAQVNDGTAIIDGVAIGALDGSEELTVEDTLVCVPEGWYDPEGDPEGYFFRWYVNGVEKKREPPMGSQIPVLRSTLERGPSASPAFRAGDLVECRVVTYDGANASGDFDNPLDQTGIWAQSVEIANACWTASGASVTPLQGHNDATTTFTCRPTGFADPDGYDPNDPPTLDYRWYQTLDPRQALGSPIAGPGGVPVGLSTIAGSLLEPNTNQRLVCCLVRSCNQADPNQLICSSNSAQVINTCPRLTGVRLAFDNTNPDHYPLVGDRVTCAVDGWDDAEGEPEEYRFEWRLGGTPIPGATSATLLVAPEMAHQPLSCGAAPVDSWNDNCTLTPSPALPVDNSPPTVSRVAYDPEILYTDTDVVCVPVGWSDADGDAPRYQFEWFVNGVEAGAAYITRTTHQGDTLSAEAFSKGQTVLCRIRPSDGLDEGALATGGELLVRNSLPTVEVAFEYDAPNPERNENLRCAFDATDKDDDLVTGTFRWYLNGTLQNLTAWADLDTEDPSVFELDVEQFQPCDRLTCEVIPNDGEQQGMARSDDAQYWGGAALSLTTGGSVVRTPVEGLTPDSGTVDFWFQLGSSVSNTERVLFAHKLSGQPDDLVAVVLAADGVPGLKLGQTAIAKVEMDPIPLGRWAYYAVQWNDGAWDLLVYVRTADGTGGTWYKKSKAGVRPSELDPTGLHFGAGDATELAPIGVIDEIRFSAVRRWDSATVPYVGGVPGVAPAEFTVPLQGDANTIAIYHITSDGWPAPNTTPPLTDWTPDGRAAATYNECRWTRLALANECRYLVNVPPPPPEVELRIADITTNPAVPVNPNFAMQYHLACDITRASIDFNGDRVGYYFQLLVDGQQAEQQFLSADEVAAGRTSVAFEWIYVTVDSPCPTVTCSVEPFDGLLRGAAGEDTQVAGYANLDDLRGPLMNTFDGLGFGCATANACLVNRCITDLGGCVFDPRPGPCNDGDGCTGGDACVDGVCLGSDVCDDSNQCTTHTCTDVNGTPRCDYEFLTGACSDGNVCTIGDTCNLGFCVPGYQQDCDDDRDCTSDRCDETLGCVNDSEPYDGTPCENANLCTIDSECQGGNCVGGDPVPSDDRNQCTIDGCDPVEGVYHSPRLGEPCVLSDKCVESTKCQMVGANVACVGSQTDCNDSNVCTSDGCEPLTGCYHRPNDGVECNDRDPCTIGDICASGICQPGRTPLNCNDGNRCTTDICVAFQGCTFPYNADPCSDANACTENDKCQAGICFGTPISCNDNNQCTLDYCDAGTGCIYQQTTAACNDGNACTTGDTCVTGVCRGTTITCNDNNPCTDDVCDGNLGCVYTNNNATCTDGNPCTEGDHCQDGLCVRGQPKNCNDNNVCTADQCNTSTGICDHIAQPGTCEDGNLCTLDDYCQGGVCRVGTAKNCDDAEFCTIDGCDTTTGACTHANRPANTACTDGDPCTQGDICRVPTGGTVMRCTPGTARNCDDNNVCTVDTCDTAGNCVHRNQDNLTCDDSNACTTGDRCLDGLCSGPTELSCNDSNPCTSDSCAPASGCVNTPKAVGSQCDDANACTINDACQGSPTLTCRGTTVNCDDNNTCTSDFCGATGVCQHTNLTGSCSDGNPCTTGDACQSGACQSGAAINCADTNSCTTDTCDSSTPVGSDPCKHAARAIGSSCSDGDACTLTDRCVAAAGGGLPLCEGTVNNCDDGNPCTQDVCNADGTCGHANITGGACDDSNACSTGTICQAGTCGGGSSVSCDDSNSCTVDTCNTTTGCVNTAQAAGTLCNDGNACTTSDKCTVQGTATLCVGTGVTCNDNNPCTDDTCNQATGCVFGNKPNGTTCDDSNACTSATTCQAGVCAGTTRDCNDSNVCTADSCNATTGLCVNQNVANNTACDDGDPCKTGDRCFNGTCAATANAVDGTGCNDRNACTTPDQCTGGVCGGATRNCSDSNPCTTDGCNPASGCTNTALADNTSCDDGDACTTSTKCTAGTCTGGTTLNCNDNNQCTSDSCNSTTGCVNTVTLNAACDDGDACTTGEFCNASKVCQGGTEVCDICQELATLTCAAADLSVSATSTGGPTSIANYANITGGTCATGPFAGPEAAYAIQTDTAENIEIFWTDGSGNPLADTHSFRLLVDSNGCNPAACSLDDASNNWFTAALTANTTYYTVLDSTTASGTGYRMHLRCLDDYTCIADKGVRACDQGTKCNLVGEDNDWGDSGSTSGYRYATACTGGTAQDFDGPDRVYTFTAPENGSVTLFLTHPKAAAGAVSPDDYYHIFIVNKGTNGNCNTVDPRVCEASSFNASGTPPALPMVTFAAQASSVYCIIVDSKSPSLTEQFVLSIGCFF